MARLVILFALCVLPALVSAARPTRNALVVEGRVYCDTCRAGFETSATTYIPGANVRIECKDRKTQKLVYARDGKTDATGCYKIPVAEEHADEICDAVLLSSPQNNCASVDPGRDRARIILTSYNGISSQTRYANNLGFMMDEPMADCTQVLQQYHLDDENF